MAKIVAVHVGEIKPQFSLLQQIDEAGMLDRIKRAAKAAGAAFKDDAPEEKAPERLRATSADDSALLTIVTELLTPPSGEVRVVLFLSHADLKKHYLISGGSGASIVDQMTDEEILSFAETPTASSKSRAVQMKTGFTFGDLIDAPAVPSVTSGTFDRAVQINSPSSLIKQIEANKGDVEKIKPLLKKLMSHGLYVMTLNIPKAKKIVPAMGTAADVDEYAKVFDPAVLENFPNSVVLKQAKAEKLDLISAAKPPSEDETEEERIKDLEKKGEHAERERAAQSKITGPTTDDTKEIIRIITNASGPNKAADTLKGAFVSNGKMSAAELAAKLEAMKTRLPLVNIQAVLDKL